MTLEARNNGIEQIEREKVPFVTCIEITDTIMCTERYLSDALKRFF